MFIVLCVAGIEQSKTSLNVVCDVLLGGLRMLNVVWSMLKHKIKNILIQFFVDAEIFDSSGHISNSSTQTDLQLRELKIKRQVEIEK